MIERQHIDGISCLCSGQPSSGELLVLLHGIGSNAQSFRSLMERLASRRPLLAWDAPGYGTSQHLEAEWPTATDYTARLARVLDNVGADRIDLLGHSLGSIVAGRFAALQPERVSRLMLVSPALGYGTAAGASLAAQVAQRVDALHAEGPEHFAEARASRIVHRAHERPVVVESVRDAMSKVTTGGYTKAARLLSCADLIKDASRIRTPTLVMVGSEDQVTVPERCRELYAALTLTTPTLPHRFEEIADAGHAVCQERPEAVAALIEAFTSEAPNWRRAS